MSLDDRKNAFENKYKHDEELKFKIEARLAKLFGLWVAEQMGLGEAQAQEYAKAMVGVQMEAPGNDDIINRALSDLKASGQDLARHALEAQVQNLEAKAKEQIMNEAK